MRERRLQSEKRSVGNAIALPVLLLVALAGFAVRRSLPAGQDDSSGPFRVSVDVALVVLHATVSDQQGRTVSHLSEQDFKVYEDGVLQHIRLFRNEDVPVTVGLVVDHSSTMQPKMAEVTAAARSFVQSSNREDEMFVVNFNERVSLGLPAAIRFSDSTTELGAAIAAMPSGGMTALYDAIAKALEELQAGSRDKKALIVFSDGGDNASSHKLGQVVKLAGRSSVVIYTIGIYEAGDPDRNPNALTRLAESTGGEAFFPGQSGEVPAICERIARDIRHQYTIGYIPTNPARNGAYRAIRVLARAKGGDQLSVRTRAGYVAGDAPRLDEKRAK